jgi:hypothetical protein
MPQKKNFTEENAPQKVPAGQKANDTNAMDFEYARPNVEDVEGVDEWEELNRQKWKGLGLSDPVKSVEVHILCLWRS